MNGAARMGYHHVSPFGRGLLMLHPTIEETNHWHAVFARILDCIRRDEKILLPPFDRTRRDAGGAEFALLAMEDNAFSGTVGRYRYQFEGEDDLLHLFVMRSDHAELTVPEAQAVVGLLLPEVSPALIWLRPGRLSHHFYLGQDELLEA